MSTKIGDIASQAAQATPAAVVIAWRDIPVERGIAVLFIVLQIAYLLWKWRNERIDRERARAYAPTVQEPRRGSDGQ